jgi:hypothetical protein
LWAKTKLAFAQAYFDYGSEIDWFLKVYKRFFKVTLQRNSKQIFPETKLCAASFPIPTFMFL